MFLFTEDSKSLIQQLEEHLTTWWNDFMGNLGKYIFDIIQILLIILVCKFVLDWISKYTKKKIDQNNAKDDTKAKRNNTLLTLARSVARYVVYFMGAAWVLNILGYGNIISGLLVTAGVGSLAISLGAQSLIKDVMTGFFLMFENQFSVGDYIKIGTVAEGYVEAMAMRVTYLRTNAGSQVIVPNGQISTVENVTRGNSVAKVVVNTSYTDDTNYMVEIIKNVVENYAKENKSLLNGKPSVLAITAFTQSSVDITVTCKTKNMKHWQVERELRLAIKTEFDRLGIRAPYQTVIFNNETVEEKVETKRNQKK